MSSPGTKRLPERWTHSCIAPSERNSREAPVSLVVRTDTDVGVAPRFRNPWPSSTLSTASDDAAEIAHERHIAPSLLDCRARAAV
jgi:hypothetical protein